MKLRVLIFLISTILVHSGCGMKNHKDFAFTSPEFRFDAGVIHAKLRGTMDNLNKNTSVNHAPYEMLIWFSIEDAENIIGCTLSLNSITLNNLEADKFVPVPKTGHASFRQKSDGTFIASISYKNLDIEYADHQLEFFYSFENQCRLIGLPIPVKMEFKKDYSERNISFWDVLMGV